MADPSWGALASWLNPGSAQPNPIMGGDQAGGSDIQSLAAQLGLDPAMVAQLAGGGGTEPGQPVDIVSLLQGTAMQVTGREGMTGTPFSGILPGWAKGIPQAVLGDVNFDPYLGIVSQKGDERVYMGGSSEHQTTIADPLGHMGRPDSPTYADLPDNLPAQVKTEHTDNTLTSTQVANLPYSWTEENITDAMKRMRKAGINVTSFDQLNQVWGGLVDRASMMYSLSEGKNKVTPWDVLDMYKSEAQAADSYVNYENGTRVSTSKSVAHITEGEAWSSLQSTLSKMLGRDPTDQEVRDFTYRMNSLAAKNPAISKTVSQYKAGDVRSSTTSTEGGFTGADVAEAAYSQAQDNPGYAEFQSASTYYNAALSALGAIGG
jgi:hypothetical protein